MAPSTLSEGYSGSTGTGAWPRQPAGDTAEILWQQARPRRAAPLFLAEKVFCWHHSSLQARPGLDLPLCSIEQAKHRHGRERGAGTWSTPGPGTPSLCHSHGPCWTWRGLPILLPACLPSHMPRFTQS